MKTLNAIFSKLFTGVLIFSFIFFSTSISSIAGESNTVPGEALKKSATEPAIVAANADTGDAGMTAKSPAAGGAAGSGAATGLSPLGVAGVIAAVGVAVAAIAISLGGSDSSSSAPAHK